MSMLVTVSMPENEILDQMPAIWQERIAALDVQYSIVGRVNAGKKIANAIVNDNFVWPGRTDENGDPMTPTGLPPGWVLLSCHTINRGSDKMRAVAGTPVVHDAGTITDTTDDRSQRYHRYYVRPVYDNTDPENPVITGVILLDRHYNPIVQDVVDDVPIYVIDGATPAQDGSYTKTWTVPAKDVPGVGKVSPESLEPNGDYIHTPYTLEVEEPALTEQVPMAAGYIDFMDDLRDANGNSLGRPTQMAEISLFGGYKRNL